MFLNPEGSFTNLMPSIPPNSDLSTNHFWIAMFLEFVNSFCFHLIKTFILLNWIIILVVIYICLEFWKLLYFYIYLGWIIQVRWVRRKSWPLPGFSWKGDYQTYQCTVAQNRIKILFCRLRTLFLVHHRLNMTTSSGFICPRPRGFFRPISEYSKIKRYAIYAIKR